MAEFLRLSARGIAVIASAVAGMILTAGVAFGVPIQDVILTGGGPTTWDAQNRTSGGCLSFLDVRNGFTPVAGGSHDGNIDGFDVGLQSLVNGVTFRDGDGNGQLSGEQLTVGPTRTAGFLITRKERALQASPTLRSLIRFENRRDTARVARLMWDSNLGSDGFETTRGTSDGDTSFELNDRWVVSSDHAVAPDDPPLVFALWGPDASVRTRRILWPPESGCFTVAMRMRVPAHSARYLLFFTEMTDDSNATALASAQKFDDPSPASPLFNGIAPKVRDRIRNWNL